MTYGRLVLKRTPSSRNRPADSNFELFRKYNREGELLVKRFRKSEFPGRLAPWDGSSLYAAAEKFGAFIQSTGEWIEFSYDGGLRGRWKPPKLNGGPSQIVFPPSGGLHALSGWLYRFDPATEKWKRVPGFPPPHPKVFLGPDGRHLVFLDNAPYPPQLIWRPLPTGGS